MLGSWPAAVFVGTVLGFLSGLGIGGGSLLILWLTLALGLEQEAARGINLLFFLPAAFSASLLRWRRGDLRLRPLLPAIAAGCTAAAVFTWVGKSIELDLMRKLFGALLILTGLRELCWRPKGSQ